MSTPAPILNKDSQTAIPSPILQVEGLRKVYSSRRKGDVVAVDEATFQVAPGEIVGLLGPNGAGKTTTIKCICTLIRPTAGSIQVDGTDAIKDPRRAVAGLAAVLEGNRNVYWRLTPKENLELFAGLHGIPAAKVRGFIDELLESFSLTDKTKAEARTLSRGMQQKLAVACAFVKQTPILLLDEPTLGLDVETSYELRESLKHMVTNGGRTILLSSHDMDVVQDVCERVVVINKGRIVTDDRVENLLELFKARAYRFTIDGDLSEADIDSCRSQFMISDVEVEGSRSSIHVELPKAADMYEIVDHLRSLGVMIDSIEKQDPNLEQIFLRIVRQQS